MGSTPILALSMSDLPLQRVRSKRFQPAPIQFIRPVKQLRHSARRSRDYSRASNISRTCASSSGVLQAASDALAWRRRPT